MHDLINQPFRLLNNEYLTGVFVLSNFHKRNIIRYNPKLEQRILLTANGIPVEEYEDDENVRRREDVFIYSSSPRRGLGTLLRDWPAVREVYPTAVLHVAYGFDLSMKMCELTRNYNELAVYKHLLNLCKTTPGVVYHGRLPQHELAKLQKEAYAWLYPPSDFQETFCITALEVMAAGAIPVTRDNGALCEVLYNYVQWDKNVSTLEQIRYIRENAEFLKDLPKFLAANKTRANKFTWEAIADHWYRTV
jgi:glycosyltransferase involved in cell wall biosynthesis